MLHFQGGDLDGVIQNQRTLSQYFTQTRVLDWLVQLAMALKYMHDLFVEIDCTFLIAALWLLRTKSKNLELF